MNCLHCKQDHVAGDRECEFYKVAVDIEGKKRRGEISYNESRRLYNSLNQKTLSQLLNIDDEQEERKSKVMDERERRDKFNKVNNRCNDNNSNQVNILSKNRFDILNDDASDDSDCDFFDMPNTFYNKSNPEPRNKKVSPNKPKKSYANVVKIQKKK